MEVNQEVFDKAIQKFNDMNQLLTKIVEVDLPKARNDSNLHKKAIERRRKKKRGGHK